MFASTSYQGSPSGATVMPNGSLPFTTLPSVITPSSVIRAMLPLVFCVNQTVPSGDAAMPSGPTLVSGNSVTSPVAGTSRPTPAGCYRQSDSKPDIPSVAMVSCRGVRVTVGVTVTAPVSGSSLPIPGSRGAVNQTNPAASTTASLGSGTYWVNCPRRRRSARGCRC